MARTIVVFAAGAAATLAAAGILAACGSSRSGTQFTAELGVPASPVAGNPAQDKPDVGSSRRPITILESEYTVTVGAATLHPGTYTFAVQNNGNIAHAINFDGPNIEDATTGRLSPGQTDKITLKLAAGTYRVYCPMPHHKSMGMHTTIDVG